MLLQKVDYHHQNVEKERQQNNNNNQHHLLLHQEYLIQKTNGMLIMKKGDKQHLLNLKQLIQNYLLAKDVMRRMIEKQNQTQHHNIHH